MKEPAFFRKEADRSTSESPPDASPGDTGRRSGLGWLWDWRGGDARAIAFWTTWAFVVCLLGLNQRPAPVSLERDGGGLWRGLYSPSEDNAFRRLPYRYGLNGLAVVTGPERSEPRLWAVGQRGLILHSPDGGDSWQLQRVEPSDLGQPEANPVARALGMQTAERRVDRAQIQALYQMLREDRGGEGQKYTRALDRLANQLTPQTYPLDILSDDRTRFEFRMGDEIPGSGLQKLLNYWEQLSRMARILREPDSKQKAPEVRPSDALKTAQIELEKIETNYELLGIVQEVTSLEAPVNGGTTKPAEDVPVQTAPDLHGVFFSDERFGCAVGDGGQLLETATGGAVWAEGIIPAGTEKARLRDVHLTPNGVGCAVGFLATSTPAENPGVVLYTARLGDPWKSLTFGKEGPMALSGVRFKDERTIFLCGAGGLYRLSVDDPGGTQRIAEKDSFRALSIAGGVVYAVGAQGVVLRYLDEPSSTPSYVRSADGATLPLNAVSFADATTGWIAGDKGSLFATKERSTWEEQSVGAESTTQPSSPLPDLYAVGFADAASGWVVGSDAAILSTRDGGKSWSPAGEYRSRPSLLFFVLLSPSAVFWLLTLVRLRQLKLRERGERKGDADDRLEALRRSTQEIVESAVSDAPIANAREDEYDFVEVARGVAGFLDNPRTTPPLTMAITGPWGKGKTSLINLIRTDLESLGLRAVWFNAWHHQKEERLMAALLEMVRREGVPEWWRPSGVWFRLVLFFTLSRFRRALPFLMLVLFVLSATVSMYAVVGVTMDLQSLFAPAGLAAVAANLLAIGFALSRTVTAFGVNPAQLMSFVSRKGSLRDLEAQTSLRHRFALEFGEVTRKLGKPMLIIIDDLDRCEPRKVVEMLEAVNFLVSSGRCFVLLGMDWVYVSGSVAHSFKDVAPYLMEERFGTAAAPDADEEVTRARAEAFASHYLQKVINIEIPVPSWNDTPSSPGDPTRTPGPVPTRTAEDEKRDRERRARLERLRARSATLSKWASATVVVAWVLALLGVVALVGHFVGWGVGRYRELRNVSVSAHNDAMAAQRQALAAQEDALRGEENGGVGQPGDRARLEDARDAQQAAIVAQEKVKPTERGALARQEVARSLQTAALELQRKLYAAAGKELEATPADGALGERVTIFERALESQRAGLSSQDQVINAERRIQGLEPEPPRAEKVLATTGTAVPPVRRGDGGEISSAGPGTPDTRPPPDPNEFEAGYSWKAAAGILVVGLILALAWITTKQTRTYRDTPEFEDAMSIWKPVVGQKHTTPRAWKRFVNRVRYYAMREQRSQESAADWIPKTPLEKILAALSRSPPAETPLAEKQKTIPADVLVALAALKECHSGALDEGVAGTSWSEALKDRDVVAAIERHRRRFEGRDGDFLADYRSRFMEISREILVR